MINTILAEKVKMSATYVSDTRVPVSVLKAGPVLITQVKSQDKDGYWAVQIGFGKRPVKNTSKPLQGHFKKSQSSGIKNQTLPRHLKEIRLEGQSDVKVGDTINASDIFAPGDIITITGVGKGKGFAGVVKRHKFAGGPKTHGQSNRHRSPGSIGQGTTPGRVWKGKRMAGRMGSETTTIKNLHVISVDKDKNELIVSGSVPGPRGTILTVKRVSEGKMEDLVKKIVQIQTKGKTGETVKEE